MHFFKPPYQSRKTWQKREEFKAKSWPPLPPNTHTNISVQFLGYLASFPKQTASKYTFVMFRHEWQQWKSWCKMMNCDHGERSSVMRLLHVFRVKGALVQLHLLLLLSLCQSLQSAKLLSTLTEDINYESFHQLMGIWTCASEREA